MEDGYEIRKRLFLDTYAVFGWQHLLHRNVTDHEHGLGTTALSCDILTRTNVTAELIFRGNVFDCAFLSPCRMFFESSLIVHNEFER